MDLFDKAMKKYDQTNPTPSKIEEKTCHAKNFYDAMKTYVNSKKPKCQHERTFYWHGWRTCVECGLCIHRVFSKDPYSHVAGYDTKQKKDHIFGIREMLYDMIHSIIRQGDICPVTGVFHYFEPPDAGLPRELLDCVRELCHRCMDISVKCHRRSLCAAVLWEKVKSSYPNAMTLTEFSEKVGVSVLTINKTRKTIN